MISYFNRQEPVVESQTSGVSIQETGDYFYLFSLLPSLFSPIHNS
ncbi:hypothetical protein MICAK_2330003 [Microcystis aeruginosa PCC 9701]|uniref:Uncharacterized protein n=1 Tax=Microcystis aeruginosa PCC 9701 TaxID=721123 RepID=I4IPM9_MICAE|nr:hypothetical protein MICAK_2330003 [Microcystis aeruginosa PCC 9701]